MLRRIVPMSFGLAVGVAVRLLVRSQHSINLPLTIALSLAGAIAGQLAAERLLPPDRPDRVSFAATAIGALAMLLAYSMAREF